jgi:hypothetical protein
MKNWDKEKVLQWIQKRDHNILKDDDLEKFNKARITGRAFLVSSAKFFNTMCGLTPRASLALQGLVGEVKDGSKFRGRTIPLAFLEK